MSVTLRVYGIPAPQGSKKYVGKGKDGEGPPRMVEMSKTLPAWRKAVQKAAEAKAEGMSPHFTGPLDVHLTIIHPRPKRPSWDVPAGPPDLDKLQRAVGDALEKSGLIVNDSRIVRWDAHKRWAMEGEVPGAYIVIRPHTKEKA